MHGKAVCVQAFAWDLPQLVTLFCIWWKKEVYTPCKTVTRTKCLGEIEFLVSLWVFAPPQSVPVSRSPGTLCQPGPTTPQLGMKDKAPSCGQRALCWLSHCLEYSREICFNLTSGRHCRALLFFCEKILSVKFSGMQIVIGHKAGVDIKWCLWRCVACPEEAEEFGAGRLGIGKMLD